MRSLSRFCKVPLQGSWCDMRRRIGLATLTTAIVIGAAIPAGASADPSDPPSCFGQFVATAAQGVGVGPFVSGWAAANGPGSVAELGRAFKATCVSAP
jgi:hypothetical protein